MLSMRTTIDIPENLLRRAKAEAALRGMKLKDYVSEAIRAALRGDTSIRIGEAIVSYGNDERQVLGEGCVFPLIRVQGGHGGPALRDLTPERVSELQEEDEVERALEATRRPRRR